MTNIIQKIVRNQEIIMINDKYNAEMVRNKEIITLDVFSSEKMRTLVFGEHFRTRKFVAGSYVINNVGTTEDTSADATAPI